MARLETSAIVWLSLLGAGVVGIVGVGGYAAYRLITEPEEPADDPPVHVAAPPAPATAPARPGPAALTPRFTAEDAQRAADEAYRDLWAGIAKRDAEVAIKYVPAAKLRAMTTGEEAIDSFLGLSPIENVRVVEATTAGDRAVLFAKASSPSITDERGRPAPVDVVVRMAREDGHWTVQSQLWLVSSDPAEQQADALAWLKQR
jgi:hypothetical protein